MNDAEDYIEVETTGEESKKEWVELPTLWCKYDHDFPLSIKKENIPKLIVWLTEKIENDE